MLPHIFDDAPEHTRNKVAGLYAILVAANIGVWLWAAAAFHENAFLLGTAFLAYSFGLRHAFDADHIAAIDNITRAGARSRSAFSSRSATPRSLWRWCSSLRR
jgi:nickel/cobalt transporter (NiCoT) family protein